MKSTLRPFATLGLLAAGSLLMSATASADVHVFRICPDAARTYCITDPLKKATSATVVGGAGQLAYTDDNNSRDLPAPFAIRGTEVVWEVIGTFGFANAGEAYCGYLSIPPTNIGAASRNNIADGISDCVGVLRYRVPDVSSPVKSARLHIEGANLGAGANLAVTLCEYDNPGTTVDNENPADPDCIVSRDDFGGATFTGIKDITVRRADNSTGLVGGTSEIDFLNLFPVLDIELAQAAIDHLNANAGSTASMIVRCADTASTNNGFLGGLDNVIVLHDELGLGFPGNFGAAYLEVDYDSSGTNQLPVASACVTPL